MEKSMSAERGAWALFAAGAAWPFAYDRLAVLAMSPLEQALRSSYCGGALQEVFQVLGHCVPCWTGAAALLLAGAGLLLRRPTSTAAPRH